ncbi:uncharacterized protein [Clytia hemisphaerica]|uniref:uncharacterized protein n=1 Tax=Clytia hemisphaerica TaxID=252671 RepID=UPI0034D79CC7
MESLKFTLVILSMVISMSLAESEFKYFRGGHFRVTKGGQINEILIDYRLFFVNAGNPFGDQCTKEARANRSLIDTGITIHMWNKDPTKEPYWFPSVEIGNATVYCVLKDDGAVFRAVGEYKGLAFKTNEQKMWIGIKYLLNGQPSYITAHYDTSKREDTGKINTMPKVNVFPYYVADSDSGFNVKIHAVDEDHDDIRCYGGPQNTLYDDCTYKVPTSLSNGVYTVRVTVKDFRNKDATNAFSTTTVVFELRKAPHQPPNLKPKFSMMNPYTCIYQQSETAKWTKIFQINYGQKVTLNKLHYLAPAGMRLRGNGSPGRAKVLLEWTPQGNVTGKHMFCFYVSALESSNLLVHISDVSCFYVSVGEENRYMKVDFISPRIGSTVPANSDLFELKIHGAFGKPRNGENYLVIRNKNTNQMKAMMNIANQMQSTITNDNRLIIKLSQPLDLVVNETYYVYIFGELIESQSKCIDIEKQNEESGFTLGWEFTAGEKQVTTTPITTTTTPTTTTTTTPTTTMTTPTTTHHRQLQQHHGHYNNNGQLQTTEPPHKGTHTHTTDNYNNTTDNYNNTTDNYNNTTDNYNNTTTTTGQLQQHHWQLQQHHRQLQQHHQQLQQRPPLTRQKRQLQLYQRLRKTKEIHPTNLSVQFR